MVSEEYMLKELEVWGFAFFKKNNCVCINLKMVMMFLLEPLF